MSFSAGGCRWDVGLSLSQGLGLGVGVRGADGVSEVI